VPYDYIAKADELQAYRQQMIKLLDLNQSILDNAISYLSLYGKREDSHIKELDKTVKDIQKIYYYGIFKTNNKKPTELVGFLLFNIIYIYSVFDLRKS